MNGSSLAAPPGPCAEGDPRKRIARHHLSFETAAAHASLDVPIAQPTECAGAVRAALVGRKFASVSLVIVLDGAKFVGVVRIEHLLAAAPDTSIEALADRTSPRVEPGVDQEVAAWHAVRRKESALPVLDREGCFHGVIPPHRLLAILLSEHEEDLSRAGGFVKTTLEACASSEEPVPRRFRHRLPWLLIGLAGALASADVVSWFEARLRTKMMLAFFLPGIVYLADAVGTQTETVVVRGLSLGVPMRRMLARELLVGLAIGVVLGAATGPLIFWRWGDAGAATCVALAVFATCSTATAAAVSVPWLLHALGLDPAFGSGPLSTVIQDLVSILVYLAIAMAVG